LTNGPTPWGSTIYGADEQSVSIISARPGDRGSYTLYATNTCGTRLTGPVYLSVLSADVGTQGGVRGSDGLFDNNDFIAFITMFFDRDPLADVGSVGGVIGRDFLYDNNDFIVFINLFFGNCP
ncbi:MAG: GC-type dockerin domain-anchored protein, partial [Phycisphaerales bacterium]|nr:GC-type dockerin domain-anchored protein [Phycisphaerales bacterium]